MGGVTNSGQRQALARIETSLIPLRRGEITLTLEDVTRILGVRSEGEPFLSIPPKSCVSYASACTELLGKDPVEEASESRAPGVRGSVQGESSHPLTRATTRALAESGDPEGIRFEDDASSDEDTVSSSVLLSDEERRERESETIRDAYERAMIMSEPEIDWTPMSIDPVPLVYVASSRTFRTTTHLICMFLVMPYFLEEGSIPLSLYEKYKVVLRDVAALNEHGEGVMREQRTAYLDEGRSSTDEVASLHAERDSAVEEPDSIAEDFEHLRQNFDRMVADSLRDNMERVRSIPSFSFVALTLLGPSLDRIRALERCVDRYRSERR
ncbi:hypothetical protein AMTR_s00168p00069430 [Amborella trichopoda]|uniref:Uncharacterized protein n=1 Tax=Amborella trichopoda TaxID=13333 RepID=W1PJP2_AMBTC|nr:hypothetical protein AMTR_s00168p00069430 [Amborella trichopoda]